MILVKKAIGFLDGFGIFFFQFFYSKKIRLNCFHSCFLVALSIVVFLGMFCVRVLFIYTICINVICVLQKEPSLVPSNQQIRL